MRAYVRQRRDGKFEAVWCASRRFDTYDEAHAASLQSEPPPPRYKRQKVSERTMIALTKLADSPNISYGLIARAMNEAGALGARGGRWSAASVRAVVLRGRKSRAEADARARAAEWTDEKTRSR